MPKANKLILVGWDAPIAYRVYEYAKAGKLPVVQNLIKEGTYANNLPGSTPYYYAA